MSGKQQEAQDTRQQPQLDGAEQPSSMSSLALDLLKDMKNYLPTALTEKTDSTIEQLFGKVTLNENADDKMKVKLGENSEMFRAPDGSTIIYRKQIPGRGDLFISDNGKNYREVAPGGYGGSNEEHKMDFADPSKDTKSELKRTGNEVSIGDKIYKKVDTPKEIEATKMPDVREPSCMFKLPDGKMLYMSQSKYNFQYETVKAFIGTPGNMKEIKIDDIQIFRDGGTANVSTSQGTLYIPAEAKGGKAPTWNGKRISEEDPDNYAISEDRRGFSLKKK